ncbi:MAG: DUF2764 family protein [Deinococcota bacterium]
MHYYTLIASLPALPHPERVARLPISTLRFAERLTMLTEDDARVMHLVEDLIQWQNHPVSRSDAEVIAFYSRLQPSQHTSQPWLASSTNWQQDDYYQPEDYARLEPIISFRLNQRTLLAALRRRHLGQTAPATGEAWGVSPWLDHIRRNWQTPDFNLGGRFAWLSEARELLEADDSVQLEKQQMNLTWRFLESFAQRDPFSFGALLAYRFKWDMVQRALSYDVGAAQVRLEALLTESLSKLPADAYLAAYLTDGSRSITPEVSYEEAHDDRA